VESFTVTLKTLPPCRFLFCLFRGALPAAGTRSFLQPSADISSQAVYTLPFPPDDMNTIEDAPSLRQNNNRFLHPPPLGGGGLFAEIIPYFLSEAV